MAPSTVTVGFRPGGGGPRITVLIVFRERVEAIFGEVRYTNPLFILAVYSPAIAGIGCLLRRLTQSAWSFGSYVDHAVTGVLVEGEGQQAGDPAGAAGTGGVT
jgi:hypothetical protein